MAILSQLDQLRTMADRAGETGLATRLSALFDDYLNDYCNGKRADLDENLRHHFRRPKEYLN